MIILKKIFIFVFFKKTKNYLKNLNSNGQVTSTSFSRELDSDEIIQKAKELMEKNKKSINQQTEEVISLNLVNFLS